MSKEKEIIEKYAERANKRFHELFRTRWNIKEIARRILTEYARELKKQQNDKARR